MKRIHVPGVLVACGSLALSACGSSSSSGAATTGTGASTATSTSSTGGTGGTGGTSPPLPSMANPLASAEESAVVSQLQHGPRHGETCPAVT